MPRELAEPWDIREVQDANDVNELAAVFKRGLAEIVPSTFPWRIDPEILGTDSSSGHLTNNHATGSCARHLMSVCIITQGGARRTFVAEAEELSEQSHSDLLNLLIVVFQRSDDFAMTKDERVAQRQAPLTQAEKLVLEWVQDGKTTWETATILRISSRTVKFHLSNAFVKLNATTRTQAVAHAQARGLIRRQSGNLPLSNEMA